MLVCSVKDDKARYLLASSESNIDAGQAWRQEILMPGHYSRRVIFTERLIALSLDYIENRFTLTLNFIFYLFFFFFIIAVQLTCYN